MQPDHTRHWTPADLARRIDHTLLKADATPAQIDTLCDEAIEHGFATVCINPRFVPQAHNRLAASPVGVTTVIGFPLGATTAQTKAYEAAQALAAGADELDVVIPLGLALSGDLAGVCRDLEPLCQARQSENPNALVKVILETAALPENTIVNLCRALAGLPIDFLKTSTGFHPAGGATVAAVQLLATHRQGRKINAAGGIRSLDFALQLLNAGADRLGASASLDLLAQLRP
jgi:deoxyribose-phosphate aldolase